MDCTEQKKQSKEAPDEGKARPLSSAVLLDLNSQGLIPGPAEDEGAFLKRSAFCLELKGQLQEELKDKIPLLKKEGFSPLDPALLKRAERLYGIRPAWLPVVFSRYRLPPWHGACAWIFQMTPSTPLGALLQLRKRGSLLSYSIEELAAHEICHVGRMAFNEPRFEEILAYRSSESPFRRFFGPIVQSAGESMLFVLLLLFLLFLDAAALLSGQFELIPHLLWLKLIPLALAGCALLRLFRSQRAFSKARASLSFVLKGEKRADAALYRMTDEEIVLCSKLEQEELKGWMKSKSSLRWRLIQEACRP